MTNLTMLVRDRPTLTKQALLSLSASRCQDMTVTILDDRSQPETASILFDWTEAHGAWLHRNAYATGTGMLRNRVIAKSEQRFGRGAYLYLSDNDVFFHEDWLQRLIRAYEIAWDAGFRVLGAYNHPFHQPIGTLPVKKGKWVLYNIHEVAALATQSMLMRWEVWDKYGPFCQTPADKVCQSEDVDFTNKIRVDGFKLGMIGPALLVSTGITNTFGQRIPGWASVLAEAPRGVIVE